MGSSEATRTISGERALIDGIRRQASVHGLGSRALRLGIGDDCAVLRPRPGHEICVTTDFTLENRHFRRAWHPPESVGHRCLARGLSDLAAMGAEPLAVFLSLAIPARLPAAWVDRFLHGFLTLARKYRVPLAGGDTAESPAIRPEPRRLHRCGCRRGRSGSSRQRAPAFWRPAWRCDLRDRSLGRSRCRAAESRGESPPLSLVHPRHHCTPASLSRATPRCGRPPEESCPCNDRHQRWAFYRPRPSLRGVASVGDHRRGCPANSWFGPGIGGCDGPRAERRR